ncbi:MAG: MFS transporter [Actinomycetota bacterium]
MSSAPHPTRVLDTEPIRTEPTDFAATETRVDPAIERTADHATDRAVDHPTDRPIDRAVNPASSSLGISWLSGLEGFSRSIPSSIVPLLALQALGTRSAVSYAYLIGSSLALLATLSVGRLHDLLPRRWIVSISLGMMVAAVSIFAVASGPLFGVGIALMATAAAVFSVCVSLFTIESIPRAELTGHESRRMLYNGWAWMTGPALAGWMHSSLGALAPFALSATAAGVGLVYFWSIRLGPSATFTPKASAPPIAQNIPRFFRQRYLRIAYAVTLVRAMFWVGLFIYGPMYVVDAGLPVWVAGALLSTAAGLLLASPLIRRAAERRGTRSVVVSGYLVLAVALGALAWLGEPAPVGVLLWFVAAGGGAMVDVMANVPFMKTVQDDEKVEMTTVFSTWREVSAMLTPAVGAVVLMVGPFQLFYLTLAVCTALTALWASSLPRDV